MNRSNNRRSERIRDILKPIIWDYNIDPILKKISALFRYEGKGGGSKSA